ncbi:PAC2 family protein [Candidatus Woesearchaeota archaeon]|nr:PAC2 family protein [Candidatus Woesearchaeota archaeon]
MESGWKIEQTDKIPELKNAVLIEGLPGIGNVGKIAVDFMVENLKAKKVYDLFSYSLPHSVFIKENSLVELPKLEIYYKKTKNQDLLLLAGDIQPVNEHGCYSFCEHVIDIAEKHGCREIVTIGGIGLDKPPQGEPKVYCAANSDSIVKDFSKKTKIDCKSYGVVGPIVGATGILVGLSQKRKIPAIALLAETFAHPMYLGIKEARSVLKALEAKYNLGLKLQDLDKEIKDVEKEIMKKTKEMQSVTMRDTKEKLNYIG